MAGDVSLAYQGEAVEAGQGMMPIWQIGGGQLFGAIQSDWHIS
jgi:hypothetical protein